MNLIQEFGYYVMEMWKRETGNREIKDIQKQEATISKLW